MEVKYEIEDSKVYNRSIDTSTAYTLIDQFRNEVNQLEQESQVFHLFNKMTACVRL